MRRLACLLMLAWLPTGCVSLTPAQQRGADEVRAMADEAARIYRVPRIAVVIGDNMEGVGGTYRRGLFTISTPMLASRHRDSIVAHELAHYLLDHDRPFSGTLSLDWQREQELRELDANAKAVEILTRVRRLPEEQALSLVYDHLIGFNRLVVERRTVIPWGHRAPCAEIADLLGRFPKYRAWSASLECAVGEARATPAASAAAAAVAGGPLIHAYFTDRAPTTGPDGASPPRALRDFDRSRDGQVVLVLGVRPSPSASTVVSRWYDADGVERRAVTRRLETPVGGASTWRVHAVPMWELRPYPGRWAARVFVDDQAVGEYAFELLR